MSQHPIDDLFARRLREQELKPQRASWEELQRRMQAKETQRKPAVWWYASAASVAVLLVAAWWIWSTGEINSPQTNPGQRIAQQKAATVKPRVEQPAPVKPADIRSTESNPMLALEEPKDTKKSAAPRRQLGKVVVPKEADEQAEKLLVKSMEREAIDTELVAKARPLQEPEKTLIVQIAEPHFIPAQSIVAQAESRIEEPVSEQEPQPHKKRIRLGRILRQFNNLKSGERVEWEEVGVQPGALWAKASEKVQESKEKISSSYETLRYNTFKKTADNK